MFWAVGAAFALPPHDRAHLAASRLVAGAELRVRAIGAFPEGEVELWYGGPGKECPPELAGCLDLREAELAATAIADDQGRATLLWDAPADLPQRIDVRVQVVTRDPLTGEAWPGHHADLPVFLPTRPGTPPELGNVLVIVADDVGVDQIGAYGVGEGTFTPVIDGLAAEGVRFENAWAYPLCTPARAALQTGRHPRRYGMGSNMNVTNSPQELPTEQLTLAELADLSPYADYSSAFVGKWHLSSWTSENAQNLPLAQGWDTFAGPLGNLDVWAGGGPEGGGNHDLWQKVVEGRPVEETVYSSVSIADDAIGRLAEMPEPWLLVVSFAAAHAPWTPPPPALHPNTPLDARAPVPEIAAAMVEGMDSEIGRILGTLDPGVRGRTTVIFFGDNGTPPPAISPPQTPLEGKGSLYDGGVRVPFVVTGPLVGQPGSVSESLVEIVDVFPTVAELAGVDLRAQPAVLRRRSPLAVDGESLVDVLADPTAPVHRVLYTEYEEPAVAPFVFDTRAVRSGRYKLVHDAITGTEQFFEYLPGALDEGPDLLPCGLTRRQETARDALRAELDAIVGGLAFDNPPVPRQTNGNQQPIVLVGDPGGPGCEDLP